MADRESFMRSELSMHRAVFDISKSLSTIATRIDDIAAHMDHNAMRAKQEQMIDVHGNPIPAAVFDAVKAMIDAGEHPTADQLCRNFRQSPATMQHLIDDLTPDDTAKECTHPHRRTTGFRIECMDCGAVIGDQGQGTPVLEQQATLEHDPNIEPTYVYDDTPGEPVTATELLYAKQARDELHRNQQLSKDNDRLAQRVRDLEEQIASLLKRINADEHRKTL